MEAAPEATGEDETPYQKDLDEIRKENAQGRSLIREGEDLKKEGRTLIAAGMVLMAVGLAIMWASGWTGIGLAIGIAVFLFGLGTAIMGYTQTAKGEGKLREGNSKLDASRRRTDGMCEQYRQDEQCRILYEDNDAAKKGEEYSGSSGSGGGEAEKTRERAQVRSKGGQVMHRCYSAQSRCNNRVRKWKSEGNVIIDTYRKGGNCCIEAGFYR